MPPQGYLFFQPETNWWAPQGLTFYQVVDEIIKMRLANPRFAGQWTTERDKVADELDFFTCLRLPPNVRPMYCNEETPTTLKKNPTQQLRGWPKPQQSPRRSEGVAAVAVARVENAAAGVGVVLDWLGDSLEPVALDVAEKRAAVCAQCSKNQKGDWLQRLEGWAAQSVKALVELKNDLELKTSRDAELHSCVACDCKLDLKIWAQEKHIKEHTNARVKADLDPNCWILSEWET